MELSEYDIECINSAKKLIEADITKHYTIREIALRAGINGTKLKAGFKELFGMGLFHYQHEQRLDKGKYLLENTHKPVKEISHLLGYRYVNNFSVAFKKKFGKTAKKWRNEAS